VLFLTIALNVVLIVKIPKGFFPQQDTGAITGGVQGPQDSSFPAMNDSIQQIVGVSSRRSRRSQNVIGSPAAAAPPTPASSYIALKPLASAKSARRRSSTACAPS
jgi:multidrug efflux pump